MDVFERSFVHIGTKLLRQCSLALSGVFCMFLCNIVSCMNFIWMEAYMAHFMYIYIHVTKKCIFPLRLIATSISPVYHVSWSLFLVSIGTEHFHHSNKKSSIAWLISLFPAAAHGLWIVTSCVFEAVDAAGLDASNLHACIADVAQEMGWGDEHDEPGPCPGGTHGTTQESRCKMWRCEEDVKILSQSFF